MDWFLYDNGLRHERVKWVKRSFRENVLPRLYLIDTTGKSLNSKKSNTLHCVKSASIRSFSGLYFPHSD